MKLECLRMLATLKLDKARATLIGTFMDSYLKLTAAEELMYNRELKTIEPPEQETVMQLTNEWIRKGQREGKREGKREGRLEIVLRLLRRRFDDLPADVDQRVGGLSTPKLDELADAILDFRSSSDITAWLAKAR